MSSPERVSRALRRLAGPAGHWLNRTLALLLAVWIVHFVLRTALLFRADGFGFPLVGKADWYIFHAIFVDLHWILLWSLPFVFLITLAAYSLPRLCTPLLVALGGAHALVLLLTVVDHETLRFMGMHFDPGMMRTYGNISAARDVLRFALADASIPGLPYALFLGCVPMLWLAHRLLARSAWARASGWSLKPVGWVVVAAVLGYVYLHHIWPGFNRMRLLRPVVQTAWLSAVKSDAPPSLSGDSLSQLTSRYRNWWLAASNDKNWIFPLEDYPYYREPMQTDCRSPHAGSTRCKAPPETASVPARAPDGKPWNFMLILLETQRALNVGHLKPYGAPHSSSPYLDTLAARGTYWSRMVATGLPTINSWMSLHLSIPQHPTRYLASEFTTLRHESFVQVLERHGYTTRYFSTSDPAWDNKTPWLRQWYQAFDYDRSREYDAGMFDHLRGWLRDSVNDDTPFFITAMTKTNHYPFNPVPGVRPVPASAPLVERMDATMRYADAGLQSLIEGLREQPWFDRTIFVVMADHGFPLGEHGSSQIGYGLYTESIWMPLVMTGNHPKLRLRGGRGHPASGLDIAPTFLDLAGIREANSFMGHSLLQGDNPHRLTFGIRSEQAFVENEKYRWHGPWGDQPRDQGEELFDIVRDRLETVDLMPAEPGLRDSLAIFIRDLTRLHIDVIELDRLWPSSGAGEPASASSKALDGGGR